LLIGPDSAHGTCNIDRDVQRPGLLFRQRRSGAPDAEGGRILVIGPDTADSMPFPALAAYVDGGFAA